LRAVERIGRGKKEKGVLLEKAIPVAIGLVLFGTNSLSAQPATRQLSLREAVELVNQQNGDVRVARIDVQKADAKADEVKQMALPTVNAAVQYQRNIKPPRIFLPGFFNHARRRFFHRQ
jgi:outer membrane protein TolC